MAIFLYLVCLIKWLHYILECWYLWNTLVLIQNCHKKDVGKKGLDSFHIEGFSVRGVCDSPLIIHCEIKVEWSKQT